MAFDGIAQGCPWQCGAVCLQKRIERGEMSLADLAQHPTAGFMNQIFGIVPQHEGNFERVFEVVAADEVQGCDHGDAALPEIGRACPVLERLAGSIEEITAHDCGGRTVDEIPIVDVGDISHVEIVDCFALRGVCDRECEDQERQHPFFVNRRLEQNLDFGKCQAAVFAGQRAQGGNPDSDKKIARTIFPRCRLEESGR